MLAVLDHPVLENTKCSSRFDTTVATATGLWFYVSVKFAFLFLHVGTIVVFKQEWAGNCEQYIF